MKKISMLAFAAAGFLAAQTSIAWAAEGAASDAEMAAVVDQTVSSIKPVDIFQQVSSCRIVDGYAIRSYSLKEAASALGSCLKEVSRRYLSSVSATVGTPAHGTSMGTEVRMLLIRVPESVTVADPLYRDLNYSLSSRGRKIFGYPAQLVRTVAKSEISIASAQ